MTTSYFAAERGDARMMPNATTAWVYLLRRLVGVSDRVSPRGRATLERTPGVVAFPMRHPVVVVPARKLSYTFLCAEALWIVDGDDRVETLAKYNQNVARYSDDGETFYGAYGPRLHEQADSVVRTLAADPDTRRAVLTLWRPNPPPSSKDIPCTVSLVFQERQRKLHLQVFMRSSDTWLGVPYDWFTFTTVALMIGYGVNRYRIGEDVPFPQLDGLGSLTFVAASSHLYLDDLPAAETILADPLALGHAWDVPTLPDEEVLTVYGGWLRYRAAVAAARDQVAASNISYFDVRSGDVTGHLTPLDWSPRPLGRLAPLDWSPRPPKVV